MGKRWENDLTMEVLRCFNGKINHISTIVSPLSCLIGASGISVHNEAFARQEHNGICV